MNYGFVTQQSFCKVSLWTLENWMKFKGHILIAVLPMVEQLTAGAVLELLGVIGYLSVVDLDSKVNINPFVRQLYF